MWDFSDKKKGKDYWDFTLNRKQDLHLINLLSYSLHKLSLISQQQKQLLEVL